MAQWKGLYTAAPYCLVHVCVSYMLSSCCFSMDAKVRNQGCASTVVRYGTKEYDMVRKFVFYSFLQFCHRIYGQARCGVWYCPKNLGPQAFHLFWPRTVQIIHFQCYSSSNTAASAYPQPFEPSAWPPCCSSLVLTVSSHAVNSALSSYCPPVPPALSSD